MQKYNKIKSVHKSVIYVFVEINFHASMHVA